jgi:Tetratricopeptide repeat
MGAPILRPLQLTVLAESKEMQRRAVRIFIGLAAIVALIWTIWFSGCIALSKLLVKSGAITGDLDSLNAATNLTPADAEAHYSLGALTNYLGRPEDALKEMELAVSLRPRDYYLWLELGQTRDLVGDTNGALTAFDEAVRLAPYYGEPRWRRGSLLFRMGRYEEAFAELRNAAKSNPELLPNLIDLAWGASMQNANLTEQLVQAETSDSQLALARFFAKRGRPDEAITHFRAAGAASDQDRRELIEELVTAGAFRQAFAIWSNSNGSASTKTDIFDGGFESTLSADESGFGWRIARSQPGLNVWLDPGQPQSGTKSLRVDFNGNSDPDKAIVSQLVMVEPSSRYKLSFAARSQKILTGGPPVITVTEATGERRQLARSPSLIQASAAWNVLTVEFATAPLTNAVLVSLQREACSTSPCPIFGSLNLDSFSIEQIK